MTQKTALITGSYSGIGQALCHTLARENINMIFLNRSEAKTGQHITQITNEFPSVRIDAFYADFAQHDDLLNSAARIAKEFAVIDYVFCNAGVLLPVAKNSVQGNEMHFEVNVVAPFILMHVLRANLALSGDGRFIVSGSGARQMASRLLVDQLREPKNFKKMSGPYAQSKLAIAAACQGLLTEFEAAGVHLSVIDLPPTKTDMAQSAGMPGYMKPFRFLFKSPEKSAALLVNKAMEKPAKRQVFRGRFPDGATQKKLLDLLYDVSGVVRV